jgi:electron transport complex protein RnfC
MLDLGIASIDPATCHAVLRWVVGGLPPTARVVTVSGDRPGRHENLWVPFGVPCEHLLAPSGTHVHGGPMTGLRYDRDAVVSCTTDALLALDADAPDPPGPCIRCGWCTDHCPARLNVAALNDAFEMGDVELAERLKTLACVHCGICTYVCPARLPLSQRTQELKRTIYVLKRTRRAGDAGEPRR